MRAKTCSPYEKASLSVIFTEGFFYAMHTPSVEDADENHPPLARRERQKEENLFAAAWPV